jgi:hypothetical protein
LGDLVEVVPEPKGIELYNRERRQKIIDALTDEGEGESLKPGSFITDAARHAGMKPEVLRAWIKHGEDYPSGPLGRFAREVNKLFAARNDARQKAIWELSHKKKDWMGITRLGEQDDPATWQRPAEGSNININIGIMQKLEKVHGEVGSLTSGD